MNDLIGVEEMKLVSAVAGRLHARLPAHVQLDDLVSAGEQGLMKAAQRFDPSRGVPFRMFASHYVRFAILDSLRQVDPLTKEKRALVHQIEETHMLLCHQLGRFPERAEIAAHLGLEVEQMDALLASADQHDGIRQFDRNKDGGEHDTMAAAPGTSTADAGVQWREVRELLERVNKGLLPRERRVLEMYFLQELTLRDIGDVLGLKVTRAAQIKDAALAKARAIAGRAGISSSSDLLAA